MARTSLTNLVKLINEEVGDLSVEEQFLNDLRRSIEMSDRKNARKPSQTFKPSGMNCMRASYYQIKGIEGNGGDADSELIGICESGSDRHERIQRAILDMKENGMNCEYINVAEYVWSKNIPDIQIVEEPDFDSGKFETKLYHTGYNMSFLCDGIIKYKDEYYILEIKTESSRKFFNRTEVDKGHLNQATAYSLVFGIDKVLFVYENRDVCDKKAFMLEVTDDMKQNLIGYMENVNTCLEQNTVPPALLGLNAFEKKCCSYCQYKEQCKKDGN